MSVVELVRLPSKLMDEQYYMIFDDQEMRDRVMQRVTSKLSKYEKWAYKQIPYIFAFPLSVLATNRILNTAITRNGTSNSLNPFTIFGDLKLMHHIGGWRIMYAGLPMILACSMATHLYNKSKSEEKQNNSHTMTTSELLDKHFGLKRKSECQEKGRGIDPMLQLEDPTEKPAYL